MITFSRPLFQEVLKWTFLTSSMWKYLTIITVILYWDKYMCHKIHHFKVYNSAVSSIFTELYNYHHYLISGCFHDSTKTSHTINNHSPFPPLSFPGGSDSIECLQFGKPRFNSWVAKIPGGGCGNLLQESCLENSTEPGAWRSTVHGVTQSQKPLID